MAAYRVLLVDDSQTIRALIKVFLVGLDITYIEAPNGFEALTALKVHRPNLIIVDHNMPGMTGLDFCAKVRALPDAALKQTKVIMLTAFKTGLLESQALASGVDKFLSKPIDGAKLAVSVHTFLTGIEPQAERPGVDAKRPALLRKV